MKKTIWVNEQIDPSGLIYACIACCNESQAKDCHESFKNDLNEVQLAAGWIARMRTVESWDEVPVNSLKLN
ncbi:MAG: glycogen debranching protein [Rivularia sp. (in: cyanobacteria)]